MSEVLIKNGRVLIIKNNDVIIVYVQLRGGIKYQ